MSSITIVNVMPQFVALISYDGNMFTGHRLTFLGGGGWGSNIFIENIDRLVSPCCLLFWLGGKLVY